MKNITLVVGILLVFINTIISFIYQDYENNKMLFGNFSIFLTTGLLYLTYQMKTADGFKIGFTLLFSITGITRFICALISRNVLENNFAAILFIVLISFEILLLFIAHLLNNK